MSRFFFLVLVSIVFNSFAFAHDTKMVKLSCSDVEKKVTVEGRFYITDIGLSNVYTTIKYDGKIFECDVLTLRNFQFNLESVYDAGFVKNFLDSYGPTVVCRDLTSSDSDKDEHGYNYKTGEFFNITMKPVNYSYSTTCQSVFKADN